MHMQIVKSAEEDGHRLRVHQSEFLRGTSRITRFRTFPEKMIDSSFLLAYKNSVENARKITVNKGA